MKQIAFRRSGRGVSQIERRNADHSNQGLAVCRLAAGHTSGSQSVHPAMTCHHERSAATEGSGFFFGNRSLPLEPARNLLFDFPLGRIRRLPLGVDLADCPPEAEEQLPKPCDEHDQYEPKREIFAALGG